MEGLEVLGDVAVLVVSAEAGEGDEGGSVPGVDELFFDEGHGGEVACAEGVVGELVGVAVGLPGVVAGEPGGGPGVEERDGDAAVSGSGGEVAVDFCEGVVEADVGHAGVEGGAVEECGEGVVEGFDFFGDGGFEGEGDGFVGAHPDGGGEVVEAGVGGDVLEGVLFPGEGGVEVSGEGVELFVVGFLSVEEEGLDGAFEGAVVEEVSEDGG